MTQIFSDGAGYTYLGDCLYANHSPSYPLDSFLKASNFDNVSSNLLSLCTQSNLQFRNIASQSFLNTQTQTRKCILTFSPQSDIIDDRYTFNYSRFDSDSIGGAGSGDPARVMMYNDNGYTLTNNAASNVNHILGITRNNTAWALSDPASTGLQQFYFRIPATQLEDEIQCVASSDGSYLCLYFYQYKYDTKVIRSVFYYAGIPTNVNTGFNYYSQNIITQSILFTNFQQLSDHGATDSMDSRFQIRGSFLRPNTVIKNFLLETGKAQYTFVCSDGQTPQATWLSDFYVFEDHSAIGSPSIGKARGLLLGTGSFTIGKPVKITGTVTPDLGSRWYLPVGNYAGKTILMKCYSSVDS